MAKKNGVDKTNEVVDTVVTTNEDTTMKNETTNQAVVSTDVVVDNVTNTNEDTTMSTNEEQTVVTTNEVVDNESNKSEEVTKVEQVQEKTKAERALEIYIEVNGVRADFMKRVAAELGMSKAGGSTYFQNSKTKAAGGKVKHYYKSKSKVNEQQLNDAVDDSKEDMELIDVELKDGTSKSFMSQQSADEFKAANPDLIA